MDATSNVNPNFRAHRAGNRKITAEPLPTNEGREPRREKGFSKTSPPRYCRQHHHQQQQQQYKCNFPRPRKEKSKTLPSPPSSPPRRCENSVPLHEREKYVAMDCEMVGVGEDGQRSVVARVVLLGWDGGVLLDEYVRVEEPVSDYRTFVSGIRKEDLASDDAVDVDVIRSVVASMLQGKVLVGHALKNDLRALGLSHPWYDVRDTAKYEPFMKNRFDDGVLWPRKLKELASERLGQTIQIEGTEHCPIEDAKAAMDLYKSVRNKWEKVMEYKMKKTMEITMQQRGAVHHLRNSGNSVGALVPVQ